MDEDVKKIRIEDYDYPLPDDRIARFPERERHDSKLLVAKGGDFLQDKFLNLTQYLPENSLLVFNETKVIQARLQFFTASGARVEIFCLEPVSEDIQSAMQTSSSILYRCLVGNARKWKNGSLTAELEDGSILEATLNQRENGNFLIRFSWGTEKIFSEILEMAGKTPLPPYLKREAVESDRDRYQTIFARNSGSVAAPTASLHFTPLVLDQLKAKGIQWENLNLHVGAGTFKPVTADSIGGHSMHAEEFSISKEFLENLKNNLSKNIIPVGTTTMRALESIFYLGLRAANGELYSSVNPFITQWEPYEKSESFRTEDSLNALLQFMEQNQLDEIRAKTAIIITPGYQHRIINGLITNFHQPRSTLLLLVASLMGNHWRPMYDFALENNFRFLSYGDSCLILN